VEWDVRTRAEALATLEEQWEEIYSVMMRSAHSTKPTKIAGLPNFAPH
jgi:hypothetical protein